MSHDPKGFHVLIVDDDPAVLTALRYALEPDLSILTVKTGEEALRLLAERDDIAAIIADQRMPGLTGLQLCEKARELKPSVRRYILTAFPDYHAAVEAMNSGAVHQFEIKPPRVQRIREILLGDLGRSSAAARLEDAAVPITIARALQIELAHDLKKYRQAFDAHVVHLTALAKQSSRELPGTSGAEAAARRLEAAAEDLRAALAFLDELADELAASADDVSRLQGIDGLAPECDAGSVATSVAEFLRPSLDDATQLSVRIESSPALVPVRGPALGHVLFNLVRNAIDAVTDRAPGPAVIEVHVRRSAQSVFVEVADSGPGIAPEDLDRVFERSFTHKRGGSGLGLAIARKIVLESGGQLSAGTRPDGGAVLVAELPALDPTERPTTRNR